MHAQAYQPTQHFNEACVIGFDAVAARDLDDLATVRPMAQRRNSPVSDLIRYNPSREDIAAEWTGAYHRRRWTEAAEVQDERREDYFDKFIAPGLPAEERYAPSLPTWAAAASVFVAVFVIGSLMPL